MPEFITIPWGLLLPPLAVAFGITALGSFLISKYGHNLAVDLPKPRGLHSQPTPRSGGLAIGAGLLITAIIFLAEGVSPVSTLLLGAVLFLGLGWLDDLYGLSPGWKFLGQILIASLIFHLGIQVDMIRNPLTSEVISLSPVWNYLLTLLWILGIVNAMNFLDGMDGLASGVSGVAGLVLAGLSLLVIVNQPTTAVLAVTLVGASLGFLIFNWHPAEIFMGDSGSHLLGFAVAGLSIMSGAKLATAALVLAFPLFDIGWAVWRRIRAGEPPWKADKRHFHHQLLEAGLSQRSVVTLVYVFSFIFGASALVSGSFGKLLLILFAIIILVLVIQLKLPHTRAN